MSEEDAQATMETGWELVSDALPDGTEVTVMAVLPDGRVMVATDAKDVDDASARLRNWGRRAIESTRLVPPLAFRH